MASTYSKITVVPPVADGVGVVPVAVSIKAPNGLTATAYTSRDGSTAFTFPATITVETTFYLTSAGDHEVSAIAGAQQVATQAGKPAQVYAPNSSTDVVVRCVDPVDNADWLAETIATDTAFTSQFAPLPAVVGTVSQVLAISDADPLTTVWADASGGAGATRVTFSNANYTIVATDSVYVAQTGTMSAARTVTLPAASAFPAGAFITIIDESGTVTATNKINVARAGSDTINGATISAVISSGYGSLTLVSDGSSKWTTPKAVSSFMGSGAESLQIGELAVASGAGGHAVGYGAQATATSANAFGYDARATAQYNTAVGTGARAISGTTCTAIGYSSTAAGGTGSTAVGYAANAPVVSGTAIGGSAAAGGSGSVAIGSSATIAAGQTDGVAIGHGATITAGSGENIAIGGYATADDWRATALGWRARATAISSTAIGRRALATGTHSIAVGRGAWANASGMIAIGFSGGDAQIDLFLESGHTHKYVDEDSTTITRNPSLTPIAIHGFDAYDATGSPTNNVAGGNLILAAGRGTGTAVGGAVRLQVAPAGGASNNTKNTLVSVVEAGCSSTSSTLGFFGATPVVKPTGVAVDAAGIHAALVSLGLIAA